MTAKMTKLLVSRLLLRESGKQLSLYRPLRLPHLPGG